MFTPVVIMNVVRFRICLSIYESKERKKFPVGYIFKENCRLVYLKVMLFQSNVCINNFCRMYVVVVRDFAVQMATISCSFFNIAEAFYHFKGKLLVMFNF